MERKNFTTTLRSDLIKKLKLLAVHKERKMNELLEEAIQDLLEKHEGEINRFLTGVFDE